MTEQPLLVNAQGVVSQFLRDNPAVKALVDDRVYTTLPAALATWPAVRITRIGGQPLFNEPLLLDQPWLQFDVWGGPKAIAWKVAETIRREIVNIGGDYPGYGRVYAGPSIRFGALRDAPDSTFDPPRPRFIFDLWLLTRALDVT